MSSKPLLKQKSWVNNWSTCAFKTEPKCRPLIDPRVDQLLTKLFAPQNKNPKNGQETQFVWQVLVSLSLALFHSPSLSCPPSIFYPDLVPPPLNLWSIDLCFPDSLYALSTLIIICCSLAFFLPRFHPSSPLCWH